MDNGLTPAIVNEWLLQFVERLRETFGDRLVFAGCQGSWARGEGRPDSDIDAVVVLDKIETQDLAAYRVIVESMPDGGRAACGWMVSVSELQHHEPRCELAHVYYGCRALHGSLDGLVEQPELCELVQEIRVRMANTLHAARHYLRFPHDLRTKVHNLHSEFKYSLIHLRSWLLLSTGVYHESTADLAQALSDADDKEMLRVSTNWEKFAEDRTERPLYYIELLERWGRSMLERVERYDG